MSTPKEKAIELVAKFSVILFVEGTDSEKRVCDSYAKDCAITCVDEIINSYSCYKGMHDQEFIDADKHFWKQVKTEITNL